MRKITLLLLSLLLGTLIGWGQSDDIILQPGIGIGKIKLGMTEAQAIAVLGEMENTQRFGDVMKDFKDFDENLTIDSLIQFVIGFEKCLTVAESTQEKIPIFKLYFNKGRLVFIAVTSYGNTEAASAKVRIGKNVRFMMTQEEVEGIMGTDYMKLPYREYYECAYYKKGIEFMYDENLLRFVGIFKPDPAFPQKIKQKSAGLWKQWEEL